MRQFTMNISDTLLLAAKEHALRSGSTLSDLVRNLLAREVGWSPDLAEHNLDEADALPVLQRYSAGEITRKQAMQALSLSPDRYGDFCETMARLAVAWPQPDREQIDREADIVVHAIGEAADED